MSLTRKIKVIKKLIVELEKDLKSLGRITKKGSISLKTKNKTKSNIKKTNNNTRSIPRINNETILHATNDKSSEVKRIFSGPSIPLDDEEIRDLNLDESLSPETPDIQEREYKRLEKETPPDGQRPEVNYRKQNKEPETPPDERRPEVNYRTQKIEPETPPPMNDDQKVLTNNSSNNNSFSTYQESPASSALSDPRSVNELTTQKNIPSLI